MLTVGYWTLMAWAGWMVTTGVLLVLYGVTAALGQHIYKRLRRIYALHVIRYWLERLEREGTHVFERVAEQADKAEGK